MKRLPLSLKSDNYSSKCRSNEAEEVSKAQEERDEFKAEVSKLQLEVEGLKAQVANNDNDYYNNDYDDDVVDD